MVKKPKDPKPINGGGGDIFKTLFGDIPDKGTSFSSVFSDDNPFRRKPIDQLKAFSPPKQQRQEEINSRKGDSESSVLVEEKKRKRKIDRKEPNSDPGLAPEALGIKKKSKRDAQKSHKFDNVTKGIGDGEGSDLGLDSEEVSRKGRGKKPESGIGSKESVEENNGVVGLEVEGEDKGKKSEKKEKKKKKRKRDELEAEYEAKRYGAVVEKDEGGEEGGLGGKVVGEKRNTAGKVVGEKRKTSDNPEDMFVSKEGFDDEDKLLRTVFVGNLPLKVKKKVLLKEFSQFGEVESVRIRSIPLLDNKTPRKGAIMQKKINDSADGVHAYVVFKSEHSAQASLAHNMAVVGGNHIRVDRACPPRKKLKGDNVPLYDNKRTVFVGNLPFDVKDEELYKLFCGLSNLESDVEAIRVVRDANTSLGKGIAYVLFKTRGAANVVINKRDLKLRDRELRLSHAKSTPSKRENQSPYESQNYPAKKFAGGSRTPDSSNKFKSTDSLSYQGVRASKSGVQKKVGSKIVEQSIPKSASRSEKPAKQRSQKRPAVEARKSKALKQAGQKRKMESQTPESSRGNKKARQYR